MMTTMTRLLQRRCLLTGGLFLALILSFGTAVMTTAAEAAKDAPPAATKEKGKSTILGEDSTLWALFLKGGLCMWPILACSVTGLAFFFERVIELRRSKHVPAGFDKELILAVDTRGVDAGLALCLDRQSSLARLLYAALLRHGTSRQEMELAVQDEGSRMLYDLRRNCRVIGISSNVAPLWGLLGTVQGLIMAFDRVAASGALGKTEDLATGVAVALLTTAWGLLVAIPLQILYFWMRGKADDMAREVEERAIDAIVTIDRKARRSIRRIEDIEENLETRTMTPATGPGTPPNIDDTFQEDGDLEKAIITHVPTPAQLIVQPAVNVTGRDNKPKDTPAGGDAEAKTS
jgi:biopolymer transport protein ExbB